MPLPAFCPRLGCSRSGLEPIATLAQERVTKIELVFSWLVRLLELE